MGRELAEPCPCRFGVFLRLRNVGHAARVGCQRGQALPVHTGADPQARHNDLAGSQQIDNRCERVRIDPVESGAVAHVDDPLGAIPFEAGNRCFQSGNEIGRTQRRPGIERPGRRLECGVARTVESLGQRCDGHIHGGHGKAVTLPGGFEDAGHRVQGPLAVDPGLAR